jgi:hypothetical protein
MEGQVEPQKLTGEQLAIAMLENVSLMNKYLEEGAKRQEVLVNLLDELVDWFNVTDKMFEILHEARGKKLNAADIAEAWGEAADEIFGEDDDDEEDQGDPLVGAETG